MAKITNLTRETLNFITGMKDGEAVTDSLKAGETKDIDVDPSDAQLRGRLLAGVISIEGGLPAASRRSAHQQPAERRTASTLAGDASVRD